MGLWKKQEKAVHPLGDVAFLGLAGNMLLLAGNMLLLCL